MAASRVSYRDPEVELQTHQREPCDHCSHQLTLQPPCASLGPTLEFLSLLSEGIDLCVAVYSVHPWKEGNSGVSSVSILRSIMHT
ncbi:protein FAM240B isoform X1 [Globicephala melas]|uniref:protein FAM240B isoform X1 n=1 Tax=Globicephala melas TaxID=9731 RepID=UPI00293D349F|nr:protein FAM240B isoform X1 [Globicephala melas]